MFIAGLIPVIVGSHMGLVAMQRIAAPTVEATLSAPRLSTLVVPGACSLLRKRALLPASSKAISPQVTRG
ncbi:hypothetical protein DPH57_09200 [Massilia sp. YMA4]|nr:hypothetical protein DPH57_09200 [Massilia sp. YMA4]